MIVADVLSGSTSSVYYECDDSVVLCSLKLSSRAINGEEHEIKVLDVDGNDLGYKREVLSCLCVLSDEMPLTRVEITVLVVRKGAATFSSVINAISSALLLSGLKMDDVIVSYTMYGTSMVIKYYSKRVIYAHSYSLENEEVDETAMRECFDSCLERGRLLTKEMKDSLYKKQNPRE